MALYNTWYGPSCQLYSSYCQVQQWILKHIQRTCINGMTFKKSKRKSNSSVFFLLYGGFQIEHVNLQLAFLKERQHWKMFFLFCVEFEELGIPT